MARTALARRYAQAAFEIALNSNQLDRWRKDLDAAVQGLRTPGLMEVLESPKVRISDKIALADLAMGEALPVARNLVHLLISRGRPGSVEQIVAEYGRLVDAHRGIEHAEVTTAVPIDDKDTGTLVQRLEQVLGKEVVVATATDPAIIGGIVVRVGDRLLDGSVRSRLATLRRSLTEIAG